MKTNSRSYRRHRNPDSIQKKAAPFFAAPQNEEHHSANAFFQAKLAMGQAGDKYEREADAVADSVVNRQPSNVQSDGRQQMTAVNVLSEVSPVQKQDVVGKEEEKPVQKMDAPKEEEKPVQKKEEPEKKEEDKPLQKKDGPEMKEKEQGLQKKEEPETKPSGDDAAEDKKEKDGKPRVMAKADAAYASQDTHTIAGKLQQLQDKGSPLSPQLKQEMSSSIGADFSGVNIHTDNEAVGLNRQMGAQAFTHGNNIYFNEGKYNPQTSAGKHLLAHELTHVVQQGAAPQTKALSPQGHKTAAAQVQRETSTPLPEGVKTDKKSKIAKFSAGGFTIKIKPDKKARKGSKSVKPDGAVTNGKIIAGYSFKKEAGKIVSVTISKQLVIQTTYGVQASSEMDSAYGRGSLKKDKAEGHGTLGFHEGSHGTDFIEYVKANPYPEIQLTEPVTEKEFKDLVAEWQEQCKQYQTDMEAKSKQETDDVKDPVVD